MSNLEKKSLRALCQIASAHRKHDPKILFWSEEENRYAGVVLPSASLKIRLPGKGKLRPMAFDPSELQHVLRHVEGSDVALAFPKGSLRLGGESGYTLTPANGQDSVDAASANMPVHPELTWTIDAEELKAFAKVEPYHCKARYKPHLIPWLIRFSERSVMACAGDGSQFVILEAEKREGPHGDILLDPELKGVLPLLSGKLKVHRSAKSEETATILVESDTISFSMSPHCGTKYPDPTRFLDRENPLQITVSREALKRAVKAVSGAFVPTSTRYEFPCCRLDFDLKGMAGMVVPMEAAVETRQRFEIQSATSRTKQTRFSWECALDNLDKVLDFFKGSENLSLGFADSHTPLAIRIANDPSPLRATALVASSRRPDPAIKQAR